MVDEMPKLPKYVFRRPNGSFRYKRNVPKALRSVIPKATVYRQLGNTYEEAIRTLPIAHAEIEALFDLERRTPDSERALEIVKERLGTRKGSAFEHGAIDVEWDMYNEFEELAEALEGTVPEGVHKQINAASMKPEPHSLRKCLDDYYAFKCPNGTEDRGLRSRINRISKDLKRCWGVYKFDHEELAQLKRSDANKYRDLLLASVSPNSVVRTIGVVKAAVNFAIIEHDLDTKNIFQGLRIAGAGASRTDRLPMSDADLTALEAQCDGTEPAFTILNLLTDTGCRLGEIVGLQAADVDLDASVVHIRQNDIRALKTKTSERSIPLSPRATSALSSMIKDLGPHDAIFRKYARPRGSDAASAMLMRHVRKITPDKKVTLHSLRHRMKDKLRNSGCTDDLSMAILGHSTNTVAANYGSGYAIERMTTALEKVWGIER